MYGTRACPQWSRSSGRNRRPTASWQAILAQDLLDGRLANRDAEFLELSTNATESPATLFHHPQVLRTKARTPTGVFGWPPLLEGGSVSTAGSESQPGETRPSSRVSGRLHEREEEKSLPDAHHDKLSVRSCGNRMRQ